jgi:hypothetical protein
MTKKQTLNKITKELQNIFYKAISKQSIKTFDWVKYQKDIDWQYAKMKTVMLKNTESMINKTFYESAKKSLVKTWNTAKKKVKYSEFYNDPEVQKTVNKLVNTTNAYLLNSAEKGRKNSLALLNSLQKDIAYNAQLKSEGETLEFKNVTLNNTFVEQGQFVTSKNGSRKYNADYYSEMVYRTETREAQSLATKEVANSVGSDLVQVSSHNTLTPLCMEYEGKIFSLNGKNTDFPILSEEPPFHVNCLHSISVVTDVGLEVSGTYDDYVKFSNGEIDTPPTKSSFVPVKDRTAEWIAEKKASLNEK